MDPVNAQLRSTILREARPAEATDVRLELEPPGWRLAWQLDGGRRTEPFGPIFLHVSHAAEAAREVRIHHELGL